MISFVISYYLKHDIYSLIAQEVSLFIHYLLCSSRKVSLKILIVQIIIQSHQINFSKLFSLFNDLSQNEYIIHLKFYYLIFTYLPLFLSLFYRSKLILYVKVIKFLTMGRDQVTPGVTLNNVTPLDIFSLD